MTTKTNPAPFPDLEETGIKIRRGVESSRASSHQEAISFAQLDRTASWPDSRLISSARCDPPDEEALDALVARYWDFVFARCQMLVVNREKALDLAQATWWRVVRARHALKPEGNFPAYLNKIATNLFRDSYRTALRAGAMAEYRLESLDAAQPNDDGETVALMEIVPDSKSLHSEEQALLAIDIDRALEQLTPRQREVLVARFIDGESCAEIGARYGRTEQAVSGWVREALRQMKTHLEEPDRPSNGQASE